LKGYDNVDISRSNSNLYFDNRLDSFTASVGQQDQPPGVPGSLLIFSDKHHHSRNTGTYMRCALVSPVTSGLPRANRNELRNEPLADDGGVCHQPGQEYPMKKASHMVRENRTRIYEIKVQGHLDESWADWFEGMTITVYTKPESPSITTLTGEVVDQSALQGILLRIHDLNIELISVTQIGPEMTDDQSLSKKGDMNNGD
jgi:hypothetical protein